MMTPNEKKNREKINDRQIVNLNSTDHWGTELKCKVFVIKFISIVAETRNQV